MKIKKFGATEQRVYDAALPFAGEAGADIYDVVFEKEGAYWYLRVFLDKDNGVDMTACEAVTRPLNKWLDETDPIEQSYVLEVGSPGTERKLTRSEHFDKATGKTVTLRLIRILPEYDGQKDMVCELKAYDKDFLTVLYNSIDYKVKLADIAFAKLGEISGTL